MSTINNHALAYGATVFASYSTRSEINVAPEYQRNGDVWTLEKKQLLIDSIINRYDMPKIYYHKVEGTDYEYSIIDGRQRLETIWSFIEGSFSLSDDFSYLRDDTVNLKGMTYNDLAKSYPKIKNQFDSSPLPIVVVETNDLDLIEDMFSRLNEAVPLNSAEKRNAMGGYCISAVNKLSRQHFFTKKIKFKNSRYQHRETSIRLLFIEHCLRKSQMIVDTKKVYLDSFAKEFRKNGEDYVSDLFKSVSSYMKYLASIFIDKDKLLATQANIPIYYLIVRRQLEEGKKMTLERSQVERFHQLRTENRKIAEDNISKAEFRLLEFDRLTQQGTNDASSIRERAKIMWEYLPKV